MRQASTSKEIGHPYDWRMVIGAALLVSGIVVLAEQALQTGYLPFVAPVSAGIILAGAGFRDKRRGYIIIGSIVWGVGLGLLLGWSGLFRNDDLFQVGSGFMGVASGFGAITVIIWLRFRKIAWWPLIPAAMICATGLVFMFTGARFLDFVLVDGIALGLCFLCVGVYKRLIGLIIPGCLLIGFAPGVAFAWGQEVYEFRALAQTGTMLVWFSLGWALITLVNRMTFHTLVWWPLIPGGILAMVGWGLYIGGNPGNAASFIGNTGSIVMIIFGLYLLLMRRGIRK
jgi:hypothetical protein